MKYPPHGRWLPSPYHSLLIFLVWLLLNSSVSAGNVILGLILAFAIPLLTNLFQQHRSRMVRPDLAMVYIGYLIWDIIKSNLEVIRLVLGPMSHLKPGMIAVPLDIRETLPITMLANTITLTPGTVSAEVSADKQYLYVHCLHLEDEAARIAEIKQRYETPLKRIFEC